MGIPSRPRFLVEGPADACVISGQSLGWKNCTTLAFAMGIDKSTLGKTRLSGCQVRKETGDISGGTTIEQCAAVARAHGVAVEVHTGSAVATPYYLAVQLQAGRGSSLAGNCSVLGKGNVNHNVWVNEASGGTLGYPTNALVFDPWSDGPAWWAWSKVIAFAKALRPWGEGDRRTLANMGINGVYAGIFPDTEPHFHSRFGGVKTSPFPDGLRGRSGASLVARRIRPGPGTQYAPIATLAVGATFSAYQWMNGEFVDGRQRWYGNHDGNQWVAAAGITGEG